MNTARVLMLPVLVALTVTLAACAPEAPVEPAAAPDEPATAAPQESAAGGSEGGSGTCPTVPQEGYELFSSEIVVAAPADGAVYGDGTPISWTFADGTVTTVADVDMSYINEAGDAIPMGGIFLEDFGDNEWGSTLNVFTSDADGRPGFMTLGLTQDADATGSGEREIVGTYCVTFKVAP